MKKEVIVISALWCPSCLILKKEIKKLQEQYEDINIKTLDFDIDEDEVKELGTFDTLPVIIYEDNKLIGEHTYDEIVEFLKGCEVI